MAWFDALAARGQISVPFNDELFLAADSRFPELAGLAGAIVGSFYALLVCFLISFPVGLAAAVYLEEFARKGRSAERRVGKEGDSLFRSRGRPDNYTKKLHYHYSLYND